MVKKIYAWASVLLLVSIQTLPMTLQAGQASESSASSTSSLVAEVSQRIEPDRLEVRVSQGKQVVQLGSFLELWIVTPLGGQSQTIENLAGKSVAIVPSEKRRDRWEVYVVRSVASLGRQGRFLEAIYKPAQERVRIRTVQEQMLAESTVKVKQVLVSSRRRLVEIKLDGHSESDFYLFQLKSGDALLVL